jgi:hypothetical protein
MTQQDEIKRLNSAVFGNGAKGIKDKCAGFEEAIETIKGDIAEIKENTNRRASNAIQLVMMGAMLVGLAFTIYNDLKPKEKTCTHQTSGLTLRGNTSTSGLTKTDLPLGGTKPPSLSAGLLMEPQVCATSK